MLSAKSREGPKCLILHVTLLGGRALGRPWAPRQTTRSTNLDAPVTPQPHPPRAGSGTLDQAIHAALREIPGATPARSPF